MDFPPYRRWMYNRLQPKKNGYTDEFILGMEEFMKFVCEQPICLSEGVIRCPCIRCKNEKYHTPDLVNVHLYRKGFIPHYWYWTAHGEVAPPIIFVNPLQPRNVSSNTSTSNSIEPTLQHQTIAQPLSIPQPRCIPTQSSHPAPSMHASPTDSHHSPMQASPPTLGTSSSPMGGDMSHERMKIKPFADGFYPHSVISGIASCIRRTLGEAKPSWKKLSDESRNAVWEEFKKMYTWNPCDNGKIRKNFEKRASSKYSQISQSLRKKAKRPYWMGNAMWKEFTDYWQSPQFKTKSDQNKRNRESSAGASLHTGGSIPHSLIYEKMRVEGGVDPSFSDFYFRTHRKKKDQSWVGNQAASAYETFEEKKAGILSQCPSTDNGDDADGSQQSIPLPSNMDIFISSVGGKKKGRVFGLGDIGRTFISSRSSGSLLSAIPEDYELIRAQVDALNASLQKSKEEKEALRVKLVEINTRLDETNTQLAETNTQLAETTKNVEALKQHLGVACSSSHAPPQPESASKS